MSQQRRKSVRARPLAGRRIVVTRAREQAAELVHALEQLGADVVAAATIRIEPLADLAPLGAALRDPRGYDWIVFTSRNAVQVVCERGAPPPQLGQAAVAAVGPATAAALRRYGITPDLVPREFVAEAVVEALAARGELRGKRVLLPSARAARDVLPAGLRARGATVDVIPVYETVGERQDGTALGTEILARKIDAVTFTSSSTVRHFVDLVGREAATSGRFAAAVIGPVTAATARELGVGVAVEAEEYTASGLVAALVRYFSRELGGGKPQT